MEVEMRTTLYRKQEITKRVGKGTDWINHTY
jgi:hypothetical protein